MMGPSTMGAMVSGSMSDTIGAPPTSVPATVKTTAKGTKKTGGKKNKKRLVAKKAIKKAIKKAAKAHGGKADSKHAPKAGKRPAKK